MLAVHPEDSQFLALASRVDGPDFSCSLHVSGDGGSSWVPARPLPRLPKGAAKCYAPEVAIDRRGVLYFLFVGLRGTGNVPMGAFLVTSRDHGLSFSVPRRVLGPLRFQVRMAIDDRRERTRVHLVWLQPSDEPPIGGLPPTRNPIMAAYSDDKGRTFSPPVQVSDPDRQRVVAPSVAVATDGRVQVAYFDLEDDIVDYQGLEGPRWEGTWSLLLASSRDGARFDHYSVVDDEIVPPERVTLIFTMPAPAITVGKDGSVFVAWWDATNGDWDVFLRRGADHGRRWGPRQRLNDDGVGNGRHQYLPALAASRDGEVEAVFYDRRRDPENRRNHVSYTYSTDGGRRFAPTLTLTGEPSDTEIGPRYPIPSARGLVEFGSRIALRPRGTASVAAWTDTRNTFSGHIHQDVFAARVARPGEQEADKGWSLPPVAWGALAATTIGTTVVLRRPITRRRCRARKESQGRE